MSGIFLFLSYAPFWQSWSLWLYMVSLFHREKHQQTLWTPFITWLLFHTVQYHWLIYPLQEKLNLNVTLGVLFVIIAALIHTALFIALLWIRRHSKWAWRYPVLSWVIVGIGFEWLKLNVFGGFPWVTVAISQMDWGFSLLLPILGSWGVCGFVFAVSGLMIEKPRYAIIAALCVTLLIGIIPSKPEKSHEQLFRIYQISNEAQQQHLKYVIDRVDESKNVPNTISVFPEGTISIDQQWLQAIRENIFSSQANVVLGANLLHDDGVVTNSAVTIDGRYDKQELVPFGEGMPFGFGWITQYVGLTPFISGDKYQPLKLIDQWYNVLICYDIFFPERYLRFGNRPMILLLDDHWYKNSWVREYHFRQAQVVSLILGQNLVSSSADGVSGFIEGGQIHLLDTKVQGFISKSLKVFDHTNQAWLHWLDTACRLLAILGIVIYSLDAISGRKRVKTKQL